MQDKRNNRRVRAEYAARAAAAGLAVGSNLYALGAGTGISVALNAAWLGALPVAGLAVLLSCLTPGRLQSGGSREFFFGLSLLLALSAAVDCCALGCFAQFTLLERARLAQCVGLSLLAAALCACSGDTGVSRVCYAVRFALPLLLVALLLRTVRGAGWTGLFPVLGPGAGQVGLSALLMTGACSPVLALSLRPSRADSDDVPGKGFFALRVGLGAGLGVLLLLGLSLCGGWEILSMQTQWGARMRLVSLSEPSENIGGTLLFLLLAVGLALSAAFLLCAAAQSMCRAFPKLPEWLAFLPVLALVSALCLAAVLCGAHQAAWASPVLGVGALILCLFVRRRKHE